ncbi:hypothetical protein FRACA_1810015 [Frankia canadensis]|uniref:Uncharacterized protein n=1 Tax=Frankia canadensis TaxID=1836972 RepID=A0A2I2KNS5_9ACTN|nr:hypothetical protein FRACA_1810015 [Frankia canadensis]SOU54608.1 hypothetical protein FRACA_1810015 [Frankia canadensis]
MHWIMWMSTRLLDIVPGKGPGSDRSDGDFGASNQDRTVRMLVHMVHHAPYPPSDLDK